MNTFLFNYGWIIVIIIAAIIYLAYSYKKYGKAVFIIRAKKLALELFLIAEKDSNLNNPEKMNFAITKFYSLLPKTFQYFVKINDIENFLQLVYTEAKMLVSK